MQGFKTVEEKAAEWEISPRHIQYLCRNKKIPGAMKRAGSWFIPAEVPSPAKNTKAGTQTLHFVGTKKKIFDSAIKLFVLKGFDNVSLRDIASAIGIRQSTIYNHFQSKQEILDTIYNFYCHHYLKDRPSLEEMEEELKDKSLMDIIGRISYNFNKEYIGELYDITEIIFQRIGIDERAREIGKSLMEEEGIRYVEKIFDKAVEIGRIAPFDTHMMAVFINGARIYTLFHWILDPSPERMEAVVADEHALYRHGISLLKDLSPPNE